VKGEKGQKAARKDTKVKSSKQRIIVDKANNMGIF
jgi:hypothetical protein